MPESSWSFQEWMDLIREKKRELCDAGLEVDVVRLHPADWDSLQRKTEATTYPTDEEPSILGLTVETDDSLPRGSVSLHERDEKTE